MTATDLERSALLTNDVGLHARPSVKLTQLAKRFGAHVEFSLAKNGPWVDAKSPVKVMRFKAAKGETLHFRASGSDATEALAAIVALVDAHMTDEEEQLKPVLAEASAIAELYGVGVEARTLRGRAAGEAIVEEAKQARSEIIVLSRCRFT